MTLPCPWRARRRCVCAHSTLFALRAKALQSGAPDMGVVAKKSGSSKRFAHQGALPARRGRRSPSCPFPWRARRPFPALMNGARSIAPSLPRPRFLPAVPRGERRALPAPAQGTNPLGIPFWGPASSFPVSPSPKTPQAAGPCSWGLPPANPHHRPHAERNEAPMPPARGAWVRVPRAEGTGRPHCGQGAEVMVSEMRFSMASMP